MANYSVWMLEASNITVSGGQSLSGFTQGDGSHLVGGTIRLESNHWLETDVRDGGQDTSFDDNDSNQRLDGAQTIGGILYGNSARVEAEYRITLLDPVTGETWDVLGYNVDNSSPSYATIEGLAFVGPPGGFPPIGRDLEVVAAFEGPGDSGQPSIDAGDLASPPCFVAGTFIEGIVGSKPVESFVDGDFVIGYSGNGLSIRTILRRRFVARDLDANPKLRPVRIIAGALGRGLPKRDLIVSRQHRMLVQSKIAERMFGETEVLIPAVKLTELPGIFVDETVEDVEYFHLLFDQHEVIYAEGAPTESLFTGPETLKSLSLEARKEILTIFPEITDLDYSPEPARFMPPGKQQKQLIARHLKNNQPLLRQSSQPLHL